jgi:hypothetical protein
MPLTLVDVCDRNHNGSVQLTGRRLQMDGGTLDLGLRGLMPTVRRTAGAEARTHFNDLTARVNSCPSQNLRESEFYRKL